MKRLTGTNEEISNILYQEQLELSKENLDVEGLFVRLSKKSKKKVMRLLRAYSEKFGSCCII